MASAVVVTVVTVAIVAFTDAAPQRTAASHGPAPHPHDGQQRQPHAQFQIPSLDASFDNDYGLLWPFVGARGSPETGTGTSPPRQAQPATSRSVVDIEHDESGRYRNGDGGSDRQGAPPPPFSADDSESNGDDREPEAILRLGLRQMLKGSHRDGLRIGPTPDTLDQLANRRRQRVSFSCAFEGGRHPIVPTPIIVKRYLGVEIPDYVTHQGTAAVRTAVNQRFKNVLDSAGRRRK